MRISLTDAGKRFNREWILRHADLQLQPGGSYALIGANGSGKSTLLQLIGGMLMPSEGRVAYDEGGRDVDPEAWFRHVAFCAPYLEPVEEMTGMEFLSFHAGFKPFIEGWRPAEILGQVGLAAAADKQVRHYSSGMRQRLRLAQAVFSDTPVLLLDEPCTNLDAPGIALYRSLMEAFCSGRLLVVASNDPQEYGHCKETVEVDRFKSTAR